MKPETETTTPTPAVIGVDIGKEIFHVVAFGVDGKIAFRRKIRRLPVHAYGSGPFRGEGGKVRNAEVR